MQKTGLEFLAKLENLLLHRLNRVAEETYLHIFVKPCFLLGNMSSPKTPSCLEKVHCFEHKNITSSL